MRVWISLSNRQVTMFQTFTLLTDIGITEHAQAQRYTFCTLSPKIIIQLIEHIWKHQYSTWHLCNCYMLLSEVYIVSETVINFYLRHFVDHLFQYTYKESLWHSAASKEHNQIANPFSFLQLCRSATAYKLLHLDSCIVLASYQRYVL